MLILHVGPHKTGSTYIQRNLHKSRSWLEKRGWTYPKLGPRHTDHNIVVSDKDNCLSPDGTYYASLRTLGQKSKNVILSAENFTSWSVFDVQTLAEILDQEEDEVRIIFFLRDPLDVFYSSWSEEIKHGFHMSLPERYIGYFSSYDSHILTNPTLFPKAVLRHSDFKLNILNYDRILKNKGDTFETFLRCIPGLPSKSPQKNTAVNSRYPIFLTEFIRHLNRRHANGKAKIGPQLRNLFIRDLKLTERSEIIETIQSATPSPKRVLKVGRDNAYYDWLENSFFTDFKDNLFPNSDGDSLFDREPGDIIYCDDLDMAQNNSVKKLLDFHYNRLKPKLTKFP